MSGLSGQEYEEVGGEVNTTGGKQIILVLKVTESDAERLAKVIFLSCRQLVTFTPPPLRSSALFIFFCLTPLTQKALL